MVTGSNAGFVTVWDVKTKKESLTLNNLGRKSVSAVAWDPERVIWPLFRITFEAIGLTEKFLAYKTYDLNSPRVGTANLGLGSPKLQCP